LMFKDAVFTNDSLQRSATKRFGSVDKRFTAKISVKAVQPAV